MNHCTTAGDESDKFSRLDNIPTMSKIGEGIGKPIPAPGDELDAEARRKIEEDRAEQRAIREQAIKRYQVACMAYIGAMVRNSDAVTSVWERVVEKWMEGALSGYRRVSDDGKPQLFRAYLKTVLRHEVFAYARDEAREAKRGMVNLPSEYDHVDALEVSASEAFDRGIQDTVISRSLEAIRLEDSLYFETLRLLMNAVASDSKAPRSTALSEFLSQLSGRRISEDNARTIKKRARQMFSRKIIEQVALFIEDNDLNRIEAALRDWNLLPFCETALQEMRGRKKPQ
ncbi:MAG: hypothetical protein RLZZ436_2215 [Planctomycetota bacterium]|jgi:DNA-directed RNA polymerase specialized sigma24 family protein